jgi:hypothetical protein
MTTHTHSNHEQDNLFDTIHSGQKSAVEMAQNVTDAVGDTVPELWNKPLADGIPAVAKMAEAAFGLVNGILEAQNDFTQRIIGEVTKGLGVSPSDGLRGVETGDEAEVEVQVAPTKPRRTRTSKKAA